MTLGYHGERAILKAVTDPGQIEMPTDLPPKPPDPGMPMPPGGPIEEPPLPPGDVPPMIDPPTSIPIPSPVTV